MPLFAIKSRTLKPSALVSATGFSIAISLAPLAMPISIIDVRMVGSVQKQNTSGFAARAISAASVPFNATPSLPAASSTRF